MKSNDSEELFATCGSGTWVAPLWAVRLIAAATLLMSGCLITEKKEIPREPRCPPSIVSSPSADHPIESVIIVDLDEDVPDAGMGRVDFDVLVRDCNVDQDLQWQAFLDFRPEFGGRVLPFANDSLEGAGSPQRELHFDLPFSDLSEGAGICHKVELLVSGGFKFGAMLREPEEEGDIDLAVWWVGVINDTINTVDLARCP